MIKHGWSAQVDDETRKFFTQMTRVTNSVEIPSDFGLGSAYVDREFRKVFRVWQAYSAAAIGGVVKRLNPPTKVQPSTVQRTA